MGQNTSTAVPRDPLSPGKLVENVPYTKFSQSKTSPISDQSISSSIAQRGITVVNPHPDSRWRKKQPMELQKLDKVHRFWPILRSSMESVPPAEKIPDGISYKPATAMCKRYQVHLTEAAHIVGEEQKALASRLKDLEMFSAGVAQQIVRQQEKLHRAQVHLEKVDEVKSTLNHIESSLSSCVRLVRQLNSLLPKEERLEKFKLHPELEEDSDLEENADVAGSGVSRERTGSEALYEVDNDDDDADLDDSLQASYPATTSDPVERPHPYSEVEQNWRTAIN